MSARTAAVALAAAVQKNILGPSTSLIYEAGKPQPLGMFYDLNEFEAGLERATKAFGENFLHAVAIKSNPLTGIIDIVRQKGHGAECASIGEVLHCMAVGFPPEKIIFDSPVKILPEIRFALEKGVHLNADNFQELEEIAGVIQELGNTDSVVGLRINPLIKKAGDIAALSVSTEDSKFGVPLTERNYDSIVNWFVEKPWMACVHVHIGSQSYGVTDLADGARAAVDLALAVNKRVGRQQVHTIDIGGGLQVNREDDNANPAFDEYAMVLNEKVPELNPSKGFFKKVITEFGLAFNAKAAWLVSRVEYTKQTTSELGIALINFGADICMRTCYCPNVKKYHRRAGMFGPEGEPKAGKKAKYNIAGPLCFAGDVLCHGVMLPEVQRGDYLVLYDCGASSLATFSRHCSRLAPRVIGYRLLQDGQVQFQVLKEAETLDAMLNFWKGDTSKSPLL